MNISKVFIAVGTLASLLQLPGLAQSIKKVTWQGPVPLGNDLYDVFFVDTLTGWCVGSTGAVVHTSDGGESWNLQESGIEQDLYSVHFFDNLHGWAGGKNVVLGSTNGGEHWSVQRSDLNADIKAITFIDDLNGWGCGGNVVIRTSDGGDSWTRSVVDSALDLRSIVFLNETTGWLVGENRVVRTTDGGDTWLTFLVASRDLSYSKIVFINDQIGWLTGREFLTYFPVGFLVAEYVWKTTNQGDTWMNVHTDTVHYDCEACLIPRLPDIVFADSLYGYFVGDQASYSTSDGGIHWDSVADNGIRPIEKYTMPGRRTLYRVGISGSIAMSNDLGRSWQQLSKGNTLYSIAAIQFFDTLRGCAASGDYSYNSKFLLTMDGGKNWNSTPTSFDSKGAVTDFHFVDSLKGWLCTQWNHYVGNTDYSSGLIFGTTDGGRSWTQEVSDISYSSLFGINFLDARNGIAAGYGTILRTTDGGNSWLLQFSSGNAFPVLYTAFLQDSLTGWAGGLGTLYFTNDAGHTWHERDTLDGIPCYSINALTFSSRTIGWIAGYDWTSQSGFVARSTDAGTSWVRMSAGSSRDYRGLQFTDDRHGWVVGDDGTITSTEDGGATWKVQALRHVRSNFHDIFFVDKSNGWVVGEHGAILRILIEKTPATDVNLEVPSVPMTFQLFQNFPNPFNPTTTIKYSLPSRQYVSLKTYDVLGRELQTLVDEVQDAGNTSLTLDARHLSNGVYFYRMVTPNYSSTKSMIIIK
jgi:photosystem II stability/assembly factor-like uncharacterized protein